jgi:hypothetical protein
MTTEKSTSPGPTGAIWVSALSAPHLLVASYSSRPFRGRVDPAGAE